MWILKPTTDLEQATSGKEHLNFLFQQGKFYFMDNHLAAGWCWLNELDRAQSYNLFHIDQHWDLWNETPRYTYDFIRYLKHMSLQEYLNLSYDDEQTGQRRKVFNYANYILTLHNLFPHWFEHCIFACDGYQEEVNGLQLYYNPYSTELPSQFSKWIHHSPLSQHVGANTHQWMVNIDIDYFFQENTYQMYTDAYIMDLCLAIKRNLDRIAVVTIALSPEHCGSWRKAIRVANLMARVFQVDFNIRLPYSSLRRRVRKQQTHL